MKIYQALYNPMVHESAYATLSIHKTREGAEKAIQEHKDIEKARFDVLHFDEEEGTGYGYDFCKDWIVEETEVPP